jgi:hypothetical protein
MQTRGVDTLGAHPRGDSSVSVRDVVDQRWWRKTIAGPRTDCADAINGEYRDTML